MCIEREVKGNEREIKGKWKRNEREVKRNESEREMKMKGNEREVKRNESEREMKMKGKWKGNEREMKGKLSDPSPFKIIFSIIIQFLLAVVGIKHS